MNFGSFIHKIFELGYKDNDAKSLMKLVESERETYNIPFGMNDRIKVCIENFLVWNGKMGETISTEGMFEVDLDKEHDIKYIGIIDRVIKGKDGGYLVIDYKTSKKEKKTKDLLDDKQLKGYAYAIHEKYGVDYANIWCAHYYPVTGNFYPVRFSKAQIWNWRKKEIDKVWRIRKKTKDEFPPQKNIFCDYCEFQPVCPHYSTQEQVCTRLEEQIKMRDLEKARSEPVNLNISESKNTEKNP